MSIKNYSFSTFHFPLLEMEFEFDKEMDALLRQAAQGEAAFTANNPKSKIQNPKSLHLDADEISLFAENSLPKTLRENAVAHFSNCDRCRSILSDLIAQNSENEIASAKKTEVFAPTIPWYRKLFAFPNLAYTLGALVLVFSGLIAFTVLQSVDKSQNSEVSQISERQTGGKGMSSDGEVETVERNTEMMMSNSMSNAAMSNSAASSNAMMSNTSANSAARSFNANSASNASAVSNKSNSPVNASPKDEPLSEQEAAKNVAADSALQGAPAKSLPEEKRERAKEDKKDAETTDVTKSAPVSPPKTSERSAVLNDDATKSDSLSLVAKRKMQAQSVETTGVGGKTFNRAGNAWVDAAYKGQATTNITRGTKEYKKLDSGLRGIAENLGGTVTIVWKDKAYRIQ
jgi:hypothetical protein